MIHLGVLRAELTIHPDGETEAGESVGRLALWENGEDPAVTGVPVDVVLYTLTRDYLRSALEAAAAGETPDEILLALDAAALANDQAVDDGPTD